MTQKLLNLTERTHVSAEMLHKVAFAFSRAALLMIVGRGLREIRTTCLPVALLAHPARSLADVKGVPRSSVGSPLDESDLDDELRLNPLAVPASRHRTFHSRVKLPCGLPVMPPRRGQDSDCRPSQFGQKRTCRQRSRTDGVLNRRHSPRRRGHASCTFSAARPLWHNWNLGARGARPPRRTRVNTAPPYRTRLPRPLDGSIATSSLRAIP